FNVVNHHFLIVTRAFEPQENWLTLADFAALGQCLGEVDGLGFFNGGKVAGASQPHKHLQIVPLVDMELPMEVAIEQAIAHSADQMIVRSPLLPFEHAITSFNFPSLDLTDYSTTPTPSTQSLAQRYLDHYQRLLDAVGIRSSRHSVNGWGGTQSAPYNLLCTRNWMMVVPRSREGYAGISVNSLGFAGSLLVKDKAQLAQLRQLGPLKLLEQVGS
ncbi:phosphorylase, partial [cf. Phormidesmis sp. LEGE 11477]|nr:phosphorylase [cf. Phormidesmis sp. LEGE 11477]